jgi:hypothetical protein
VKVNSIYSTDETFISLVIAKIQKKKLTWAFFLNKETDFIINL